jgi:hypothetical protein
MSGKGAKGLIMGKPSGSDKDKDKKKPITRSSRAGLQVDYNLPHTLSLPCLFLWESKWSYTPERLVDRV